MAVVRHVARNGDGRQNPEQSREDMEPADLEMPGEPFAQDCRRMVLDHAKESDEAVPEERGVVAPSRPSRLAVLHLVGHHDAMSHVQNPTYEWHEEPKRPDQDFPA